jgi:ketosteroid isomerase-like protein
VVIVGVTDQELAELLADLDVGRQSWIDGRLGFGDAIDVDQDDDMTIFGPFGGMLRGTEQLSGRQQRAAQLFEGGHGSCEVVKTIVGGDIVTVVQIERNVAQVHGRQDPQPWVLRTTQVFERRGGGWVRLHRHADPLIDLRVPEVTFALARGE